MPHGALCHTIIYPRRTRSKVARMSRDKFIVCQKPIDVAAKNEPRNTTSQHGTAASLLWTFRSSCVRTVWSAFLSPRVRFLSAVFPPCQRVHHEAPEPHGMNPQLKPHASPKSGQSKDGKHSYSSLYGSTPSIAVTNNPGPRAVAIS